MANTNLGKAANSLLTAAEVNSLLYVDGSGMAGLSELRAINGNGLSLTDDGGVLGIFVEDGGSVGIGTNSPSNLLELFNTASATTGLVRSTGVIDGRGFGVLYFGAVDPDITHKTASFISGGGTETWSVGNAGSNLQFGVTANGATTSSAVMKIDQNGYVGVGTISPGQILDINQGSGNMIADGYDNHSLGIYKENIEEQSPTLLENFKKINLKRYRKKPHIPADTLKELAIKEFGQKVWDVYFPKENSHRNKALWTMEDCELKQFVDAAAEKLREPLRELEQWKTEYIGLVADDASLDNLPELRSKNEDGNITGINNANYIGILHAVILELEQRITQLEV